MMKIQVEQEKQKMNEERELLKKKFWRMERLYNKDMKTIEKLKADLSAAQLKNDIIDLTIANNAQ